MSAFAAREGGENLERAFFGGIMSAFAAREGGENLERAFLEEFLASTAYLFLPKWGQSYPLFLT